MSAVPEETASKLSNAGTISPAAATLTSIRPPEALVIRSATRCAPVPRPGKFFGQVVTICSVRLSCAIAGALNAAAPAATEPAAVVRIKSRRFIERLASLKRD